MAALQFGIFDQNDHGRYPLSEQYDKRLALIEAYDRAGFRTYHMSEHHSTPLNLTPSPSVFLAAVAQRTRRIRFGALVYVLPAHHPLRLAEEICMLDHLSHGRLEVGIGRGASPHELNYFGIDADLAPAIYVEAYQVIMQALTKQEVNFSGKHYQFAKVPVDMKPAQLPHPPLWYAVPVPEGAAWPAQNAINIVCGGPLPRVREITDRFRAEWTAAKNPPERLPLMGINRFVIAADSDREAMALGRRAWPSFHASFMKLWKLHGTQPRFARLPEDFETGCARRRDCGLARYDRRKNSRDDERGRRDLFHQPVLLRRSRSRGGAAFRRHFRPRDDAGLASRAGGLVA
jgi:alkanesulfonate monooxygenase SsuD/methylene tetrahydromethanopterin reductase-like flavin-dependent oxidoreductase (luciferase family)